MNTQTQANPKPKHVIMDISYRALTIARILDRLSPGSYILEVTKDPIDAIDWKVQVTRQELVQRVSLAKGYVPE